MAGALRHFDPCASPLHGGRRRPADGRLPSLKANDADGPKPLRAAARRVEQDDEHHHAFDLPQARPPGRDLDRVRGRGALTVGAKRERTQEGGEGPASTASSAATAASSGRSGCPRVSPRTTSAPTTRRACSSST